MPRYFFDVTDKDGVHIDNIGIDLPDLGAAKAEGRRALLEMSRDAMTEEAQDELEMKIRDHGEGPVRLSLRLSEF